MAEKAWRIRRLYVAEETTTFNSDPDSDGSDYKFLRASEMVFNPTVEVVPVNLQTNDLTRYPHVMGVEGGTLSFQLAIRAHGTEAGNGVQASAPEADLILKNALGAVTRGTGSAVVSSTNNTVVVEVGEGSGFAKGMLIECENQRRFVTGVSGDTLTIHANWTTNPSATSVVYASNLYKPANTGHKSLAFVADIDGVLYTLLGCIPESISVEGVAAGQVAMLNCSFRVASWDTTAKGSLPVTTSATAWPAPPVVKGAPCWVGSSSKLVHEFTFSTGVEFQYKTTTEGADGKSDFLLVNRAATGNLRPYYASADWDDFRQGTERAVSIAVGDKDSGWGVYAAKCQYTAWSLEERNGMVGTNMPFAVNDNGADEDFTISVF